jgi:predicted tellurium resistance membrane protein TerC
VVWGSTLVLRWIERFPWIVHVGVAVLAWTAAEMILSEPLMRDYFAAQPALRPVVYAAVIGGVFALGFAAQRRRAVPA